MKITKEFLRNEYVANKKSIPTIAKEIGRNHRLLYKKMKEFGIPRRKSKYQKLLKVGKKFGNWTVIATVKNSSCEVRCECGTTKKVSTSSLIHRRTRRCFKCRSQVKVGQNNSHWKSPNPISWSWWKHQIQNTAKKRGIAFNISIEYAWKLFEKQNKKCALTGLLLIFPEDALGQICGGETTASIDRINSNKGYEEGNIQWVHKIINKMKSDLNETEFIQFCKLVANYPA